MKLTIPRLSLAAFVTAALASTLGVALLGTGTAAQQSPMPFGSPPSTWQDSNGQPIVGVMPDRSPVLALDGQPLNDGSGQPVTAPLGDLARGTITVEQAEKEFGKAMRAQQEDACKRGLVVPVGAETSGTGLSAEQAAQVAREALVKAVAANGGRTTKRAC